MCVCVFVCEKMQGSVLCPVSCSLPISLALSPLLAAQARKVPTEGKIDASTNTLPCGGAEGQWTVNKKCSDYDTLNALSDVSTIRNTGRSFFQ